MRIIFMGTPEFAVPSLERIIADGHQVCGVFTREDKPKGRKFTLCAPPVKETALKYGIPVFQPKSLRNEGIAKKIKELSPDVIVVVAYGRILPDEVLNIPPKGCINVHGSLLPKYRGAGPIQWSVINGESVTGITTMIMSKGIDTGDIILKKETIIEKNETWGELHDRLMTIGADLLSETLKQIEAGTAPRIKQDDSESSYAPMLDKTIAHIDFSKSAASVHNLIRGLNPWPVAYSSLNGKMLKIYRSECNDEISDVQPGEVVLANKTGIQVCCGDGKTVIITEVQEQGGKRMSAADYLVGHRITAGQKFGE